MPTVYGVSASPFVRKVRAVCEEKGIAYDTETVFPGGGGPEYRKIHPLGKIPAWKDERGILCDSSAICAYLERITPEPPLYPSDPYEYGRALWFEEYADSVVAANLTFGIFFKKMVAPRMKGEPADEAQIQATWEREAPPLFDYLESQLDGDYFVGGRFTIADLSVATQFVNLKHAGYTVDSARWPKLAALVQRIHARPSFAGLIQEDKKLFGG
jgi:glutathione S-transferase